MVDKLNYKHVIPQYHINVISRKWYYHSSICISYYHYLMITEISVNTTVKLLLNTLASHLMILSTSVYSSSSSPSIIILRQPLVDWTTFVWLEWSGPWLRFEGPWSPNEKGWNLSKDLSASAYRILLDWLKSFKSRCISNFYVRIIYITIKKRQIKRTLQTLNRNISNRKKPLIRYTVTSHPYKYLSTFLYDMV